MTGDRSDRGSVRAPSVCGSRAASLRNRLTAAEGVVLVWALATTFVLTIVSVGTVMSVTQQEWAFGRDNSSTSALDVAEAGLNSAISAIEAGSADATSASNNGTLDGGTWSYTATRAQNTAGDTTDYTWTIVSTGVLDGTTHEIESKLAETVTATTQTTTVPASAAYGYGVFLGTASSDCTTSGTNANTMSGSASVTTSIYVAGSLCLSGGSTVSEPSGSPGGTVSLYVGNKFESSGESSPVGTSSLHIKQATIVGGCIDGNHSNAPVACSQQGNPTQNTESSSYGSGVWANTYSSTQRTITMPSINTSWSTNAAPGPSYACNNDPDNSSLTSSYPSNSQSGSPQWSSATFMANVIDNTGTIDPLELVNNWNPLQNSFNCSYYNSSGTLVGELAWSYPSGGMTSSNPGTLTINGTVWLDGNLSFSGSDYAVYQGTGTIYVDGTVSMSGGSKICAKPISGSPCNGDYNSSQNLLEIVAVNAGNAATAWSLSGSAIFEGVAFGNGAFNNSGSGAVNGEVIANSATLSGGTGLSPSITPPAGAPGAAATTTTAGADQATWSTVAGSWEQLQ